jgi:WD40 repeat protein
VKWIGSESHVLCASDYDGAVTAWDTRSPSIPLSTKEVHDGKSLCLELNEASSVSGQRTLFSGGSDCCIKSAQLNSQ